MKRILLMNEDVVSPQAAVEKNIEAHSDVEEAFADGLNIYNIIWIFIIGSIFGFLAETVWYYMLYSEIICRQGVLYGPFSPIYGIGALLITIFLYRIREKTSFFIFISSGVIGCIFEYLCSWAQEMVLGTSSWSYSHTPLNLHGRVNLQMGFIWGLLGVIFIRNIYPYLSMIIGKIPHKIRKVTTIILVIFLTFDMAISGLAVIRQRERREGKQASNQFEIFLDQTYPDSYIDSIFTRVKIIDK